MPAAVNGLEKKTKKTLASPTPGPIEPAARCIGSAVNALAVVVLVCGSRRPPPPRADGAHRPARGRRPRAYGAAPSEREEGPGWAPCPQDLRCR